MARSLGWRKAPEARAQVPEVLGYREWVGGESRSISAAANGGHAAELTTSSVEARAASWREYGWLLIGGGPGPAPFRVRPGELLDAFGKLGVFVQGEADGMACILARRHA